MITKLSDQEVGLVLVEFRIAAVESKKSNSVLVETLELLRTMKQIHDVFYILRPYVATYQATFRGNTNHS